MVGVLVTTKREFKEILDLYNIKETYLEKYPYGEFYRTNFQKSDVVFFRSTNRKTNVAGACQYMINKFDFDKIFLIGTCTSVSDIDYGTIIIPTSVVDYDLTIREIEPLVNENYIIELDNITIREKHINGLIGTSDKELVTWKRYLMLKEETDIIASDMNSYAFAKICKINNVNPIIIKGVSDKPMKGENAVEEQLEVYEETLPIIIKNILENYLTEVL